MMRKVLGGVVSALIVLILTGSILLAGPEGFSGNWVANKEKSEFSSGSPDAEKPDVSLKVEASKDTFKVFQTFSSSRGEMTMDQTYIPDGKSHEVSGPMGIKGTAEAKWEGDKLAVKAVYKFERNGEEMTINEESVWELSADGSTITVNSKMNSHRGSRTGKLVYEKKK